MKTIKALRLFILVTALAERLNYPKSLEDIMTNIKACDCKDEAYGLLASEEDMAGSPVRLLVCFGAPSATVLLTAPEDEINRLIATGLLSDDELLSFDHCGRSYGCVGFKMHADDARAFLDYAKQAVPAA